MFKDVKVISVYTREQALEDGMLVDVSEVAREAGITFPTAITHKLQKTLEPPGEAAGQSYDGRLWDVLWMFRCHITGMLEPVKRYKYGYGECLHFVLDIVDGEDPKRRGPDPWRVELKAISGPGDDWAPVITIMHTDED